MQGMTFRVDREGINQVTSQPSTQAAATVSNVFEMHCPLPDRGLPGRPKGAIAVN